jgi:Amt family ammonium transporter
VVISELAFVIFQGAFRGHHLRPDRRRLRRTRQVLRHPGLHGHLVHAVLHPDGAHGLVLGGSGCLHRCRSGRTAGKTAGFLFQKGALDFAGGTVVHINAAVAGLVGAYMIGKRTGLGNVAMAPHSLTFTMIGASLLWFGWFGFNAGSALEASGGAALAMVNTWVATACAALSWMFAEWILKGKPSMLGAASGAVAGLVAITPAAGFVGVMGAIIIGLLAGVICLWGVNGLKKLLGADDSLDVFGVHGRRRHPWRHPDRCLRDPALGGTGVYDYVANAVGPFDMTAQVISQLWGVGTVVVWSGVVSLVAYKLVDIVIGLRVPEEEEREGLDLTSHGESAYHH